MDSVTQFTLGAAVGAALLGKRMGPRSGIIIGGLLGTLPDLDVFIPAADPVASFIGHRGPTHSLIVHTLVTPFISEALVRSFATLRNERQREQRDKDREAHTTHCQLPTGPDSYEGRSV